MKFFSKLGHIEKGTPTWAWAMPIVTGHNYRLHWGENNDFDTIRFELGDTWTPEDLNVRLMTNFTRVREVINVEHVVDGKTVQIQDKTLISKAPEELVNGDNVLYPEDDVREFHWVVNGKDMTNRK